MPWCNGCRITNITISFKKVIFSILNLFFLFLVNHKNISIYYLVKDRNYSRICQSRFNRYGCQLI